MHILQYNFSDETFIFGYFQFGKEVALKNRVLYLAHCEFLGTQVSRIALDEMSYERGAIRPRAFNNYANKKSQVGGQYKVQAW